jgi:hypothetical protein
LTGVHAPVIIHTSITGEAEITTTTTTCCRSETGVTVGLIDALISIARILAKRNLNDAGVIEALKDLQSDEDIAKIIGHQTQVD